MNEAVETCRIDVWLWRARFYKTRGLAAAAVESGQVQLQHGEEEIRIKKPGRPMHRGDRLAIRRGEQRMVLAIRGFGERRGPAPEARELYELFSEIEASPNRRAWWED